MSAYRRLIVVWLMWLLTPAQAASAVGSDLQVLGVIASNKTKAGIALFKDNESKKIFAVQEGKAINGALVLAHVGRKFVELIQDGKRFKARVGEGVSSAYQGAVLAFEELDLKEVVSKEGNVIRVSSTVKEYLINEGLNRVLMQAAAVPYLEDGQLRGFQLFEIEKDSIFEIAGFQNGDIVTAIDGYEITHAGTAVRQLNALRDAKEVAFDFIRNGQPQKVQIKIE